MVLNHKLLLMNVNFDDIEIANIDGGGIAFENWEGTQILMNESEYIDGYEEGVQREYHQNGQIRIEYYKKNDFVYKYMKKWNDQGVLTYHVEYDEFGNMTNAILY